MPVASRVHRLSLVQSRHRISIVTGICLTDADNQRRAVRNMRAWFPQRSYGVVMRKGKFLQAEARDFIDQIKPGMLTHREHDETGPSQR